MEPATIKALKQKERKFREADTPFGEHVARVRNKWAHIIELKNIMRHLSVADPASLLDVGCADGRLIECLRKASFGSKLYGIDFARNPLKALNDKNLNCNCICADSCEIPIKQNSMSQVVAIQLIHHIPSRSERINALKDFNRVLEKNGNFVLTVLNRKTWLHTIKDAQEGYFKTCSDLYIFLYDAQSLNSELEQAGFTVKKIIGINNLPARYLNKLKFFGVIIDIIISEYMKTLSFNKGSYLLAECVKN